MTIDIDAIRKRWKDSLPGHHTVVRDDDLLACLDEIDALRAALQAKTEECEKLLWRARFAEGDNLSAVTEIQQAEDQAAVFAAEAVELRAELARIRPVYQAACAWRDGDSDYDGELLSAICAAIDAAREPEGDR